MMQSLRLVSVLFLAALALVAAGCASTHVPPTDHDTTGWTQTGLASWYGEALQGNRTASGEPFDYHKLTAAHRNLPFGTYVEVERLDNRRRVVVRINDRGPFVRGRVIDLSKAAAQQLDMVRAGVAKVRLRVIRTAR